LSQQRNTDTVADRDEYVVRGKSNRSGLVRASQSEYRLMYFEERLVVT